MRQANRTTSRLGLLSGGTKLDARRLRLVIGHLPNRFRVAAHGEARFQGAFEDRAGISADLSPRRRLPKRGGPDRAKKCIGDS